MFESLCKFDEADFIPSALGDDDKFTPDEKATPSDILDGKINSAQWLESLGFSDDEVINEAQHNAARQAFASITAPMDTETQKAALAQIKAPQAVKHLVGMLTAYDWAFVEQAKELRGYCVAQLLEETKHPDAKYRLRAIEMLGKVTEVALFTERVEVKKAQLSDEELEKEIKTRMDRYMELMKVVDNVETTEKLENAVSDADS